MTLNIFRVSKKFLQNGSDVLGVCNGFFSKRWTLFLFNASALSYFPFSFSQMYGSLFIIPFFAQLRLRNGRDKLRKRTVFVIVYVVVFDKYLT